MVSGIVVGRAPKDGVDVGILVFLESLTAFVVSLSIGLAGGMPQAGGRAVVWTLSILFIGGIVNNRQLVDMGRAMQEGPNGIIWSIIQCGFVIPAVVGVTFLGDLLNVWKLLGFIALLIALAIMGLAGDNSKGKDGNHWKWLAFRAFLWTGVSQLLANIPSYLDSADKISGVWRTMASTGGMAFATPFFALFDAKSRGSCGAPSCLDVRHSQPKRRHIGIHLLRISWDGYNGKGRHGGSVLSADGWVLYHRF